MNLQMISLLPSDYSWESKKKKIDTCYQKKKNKRKIRKREWKKSKVAEKEGNARNQLKIVNRTVK